MKVEGFLLNIKSYTHFTAYGLYGYCRVTEEEVFVIRDHLLQI